LEFFNAGDGSNGSGGSIVRAIEDGNVEDLLTQLQNKQCDTWTPLAESFYVAMQYFKQEEADTSLEYPNGAAPNSNDGDDPFKQDGEDLYCAKNFVLLLTDGASTKDANIPAIYKDYDGDGNDNSSCDEDSNSNCDYPSGGTDYLDDIALYARTNDLRSDMLDDQNILLYNVYAMSDDDNARKLLMDAARNGGFEDFNENSFPDGGYSSPPEDRLEWDRDGNGVPDTYFEATDGAKLEKELGRAIEDILRRAASGTAVSVISSSAEGEGNLVQAFFRPAVEEGDEEIKWAGYLQSLWVDSKGNIREDTNGNQVLDIDVDRIVRFRTQANQTVVDRYAVSSDDPYPVLDDTSLVDFVAFDELPAIWKAGQELADRNIGTDSRAIKTFIDKDSDQVVDSGEIVNFSETNASGLTPYLGVAATDWDYLGDTHANRVNNLIRFINGYDTGFSGTFRIRNRTIGGETWRLGDIVYSSPIIVSSPQERFDQIYADESYQNFFNKYKNRETVVYVGANDGMLHAFTSGSYDKGNRSFTEINSTPLGSELWAYIPQTLLPHLKWLADPEYSHVHYADLTPKVFDAKILADDTHYVDSDTDPNWGTFILLGLNYGGKHIWSTGDYDGDGTEEIRHFFPTYTLIDITEPRSPEIVWERTYSLPSTLTESANNDTDLGLTMQQPSIVKVNSDWFAVFGSGPYDYTGESFRNGHVFVVDLATGEPNKNGTNDWLFEGSNPRAVMGPPTAFDRNLNYSVDSVFLGESNDSDSGSGLSWEGALYKIRIPWTCSGTCEFYGDTVYGTYDADPTNWEISEIFESPRPVSAAPAVSVDTKENSWIFFGTGRFMTEADKLTTDTDYFIGLKDPFFNKELYGPSPGDDTFYLDTNSSKTIQASHLFNSNNYAVSESGTVYDMPGETVSTETFDSMTLLANSYDGWIRSLDNQQFPAAP
jgi:type IV pilus assembly protein PilY1